MTARPRLGARLAARLPAAWVRRAQCRVASAGWLHATLARARLRRLEEFAGAIDARTDRAAARAVHLLASPLFGGRRWQMAMAELAPWSSLRPAVRLRGVERITEEARAGRGVLLAGAHVGGCHLVPVLLARAGIALTSIQRRMPAPRPAPDAAPLDVLRLEGLNGAAVLHRALAVLSGGGVVHLAADGRHGAAFATMPLCGRRYPVRDGFGHLATMSGARVLTVASAFGGDGRLAIEIGEGLSGAAEDALDVVRWTELYVSWLEDLWQSDPGNVHADFISHFLGLPRV